MNKGYQFLLSKLTFMPFIPGAKVCSYDAQILEFLREIKHNLRQDGNKNAVSPIIDYDPGKKHFDLILVGYGNKPGDSGYFLLFVDNFLYKEFNMYSFVPVFGIKPSILINGIFQSVINCANLHNVPIPDIQVCQETNVLTVVAKEYARRKIEQIVNRNLN